MGGKAKIADPLQDPPKGLLGTQGVSVGAFGTAAGEDLAVGGIQCKKIGFGAAAVCTEDHGNGHGVLLILFLSSLYHEKREKKRKVFAFFCSFFAKL
jgi:hypothetical protein